MEREKQLVTTGKAKVVLIEPCETFVYPLPCGSEDGILPCDNDCQYAGCWVIQLSYDHSELPYNAIIVNFRVTEEVATDFREFITDLNIEYKEE